MYGIVTHVVLCVLYCIAGGGTVFWVYDFDTVGEPIGLMTAENHFTANKALYGENTATQGMQLFMPHADKYLLLEDYDDPAPPFSFRMEDYYNQLVVSESSSFIEILVHENSSLCVDDYGAVSGEIIERFQLGVGNFTALQARCAPGHTLSLTARVDTDDNQLLTQEFRLGFRNCTRGGIERTEGGREGDRLRKGLSFSVSST